jgi:hypothetical protein
LIQPTIRRDLRVKRCRDLPPAHILRISARERGLAIDRIDEHLQAHLLKVNTSIKSIKMRSDLRSPEDAGKSTWRKQVSGPRWSRWGVCKRRRMITSVGLEA